MKSGNESSTQSAENNLENFQIAQALAFQQAQRMRLASMAQQMAAGGANGLMVNPFADPSTAAMFQKQYQQSLLAAQSQRDLADQVKAYLSASGQNQTSIQMQQLLAAQKQGYMASALNHNLLGLTPQFQSKAVSQQADLFPSQGQMMFPGQSQSYGPGSQTDVTTQSHSDNAVQGTAANSNPIGMLRLGNDETDPLVKLEKKEEQGAELKVAKSRENEDKKSKPKEVPIASTQSLPVAQGVPESIVAKYPWLFKDCNRLTPANRDYLIKFLEGIIPATKEEKQYDILFNEENDIENNIVQLIFRFFTGSRTWKMLKRKIRKPS